MGQTKHAYQYFHYISKIFIAILEEGLVPQWVGPRWDTRAPSAQMGHQCPVCPDGAPVAHTGHWCPTWLEAKGHTKLDSL